MPAQKKTAPDLSLYQSSTCWYCAKVRQKMSDLNVSFELRDIGLNGAYREELVREAGKSQVPCLRIASADGSDTWMYESSDICAYLDRRFAAEAAPGN